MGLRMMSNDWIRDAVNAMDNRETPVTIEFGTNRKYEVRDYAQKDGDADFLLDQADYDVVASDLTWEEARAYLDKNTTPENAGDLVVGEQLPPPFYIVCVTLHDRAYGGPEEGGWWYDTYQPNVTEAHQLTYEAGGPWLFRDLKHAQAKVKWLDEQLVRVNEGRASPNSVLSQGVWAAYAFEGYPQRIPQETPHYE
jgi:hypothetical protein